MHPDQAAPHHLGTQQRGMLVIAAIAAVLSILVAFTDTSRFFQIYLVAVLLWTEVAVGCLGLVLLNNLVNGRWLFISQRFAEAGARTLPVMALLFIPVLLGLGEIYPWVGDASKLYGGKADMLQPAFFVLRSMAYFGIWAAMAYVLTGWSYQRDLTGDVKLEDRGRLWSALGGVVYVVTTTLAALDWTGAITPEWFSSVYGWLTLSRMMLTAMALLIVVLAFFWDRPPFKQYVTQKIVGDLGVLLLVNVLVWAYLNLIQFLVIWSGNISFNVSWYAYRMEGSWGVFTSFFWVLNAATLVVLLIPGVKRQKALVVFVAVCVLLLRAVEVYWVVMPPLMPELSAVNIIDVAPIVALGALWMALAIWFLEQKPLLPVYHVSLAHEAAHSEAAHSGEDQEAMSPSA